MSHQPVYIRYPDLSENFFVFVSDDDLWRVNFEEHSELVNHEGSSHLRAFRLTTNSAQVSRPQISADGRYIAYESTESGEQEIYVMPSEGGLSQRVTYKGKASLYGWTQDNHVLVASQYARYGSLGLYTMTIHGDEIACDEYGMVSAYAKTHCGEVVARNPADIAYWKGYRGGLIGEIWTKHKSQQSFSRILAGERAHLCNVVCQDNIIFFISDREGQGHIYATDFNGSQVIKVATAHNTYIRSFSIYAQHILYMSGGKLYVQTVDANLADYFLTSAAEDSQAKLSSPPPVELNLVVPSSFEQARPRFVNPQRYLQSFAPSYTGAHIMVVVRGAVYVMKPWYGSSQRVALPPGFVRARKVFGFGQTSSTSAPKSSSSPSTTATTASKTTKDSPDHHRDFLAIAVNEHGEDRLIHLVWEATEFKYSAKVLHKQSFGKIRQVKGAYNQSFVIISSLRYELWYLDLTSGQAHLIAQHNQAVDDIDISYDHKWVSYAAESKLIQEIYLYNVETKQTQLLFKGTEAEYAPTFDRKENLLYFFSQRDIHLTEAHYPHFLTSLSQSLPYVLTLDKATPSLLARPKLFHDKPGANDSTHQPPETAKSGDTPAKTKRKSKQTKQVVSPSESAAADWLDWRDIESRIEAMPLKRTLWKTLYATDDKLFFLEDLRHDSSDHPDDESSQNHYQLHSYNKATGEIQALDQVNALVLTGDGKYFLAMVGQELLLCGVDDKLSDADSSKGKPKVIDLRRIRHQAHPQQEWDQMLVEALYLQQENLANDASQPDYTTILHRYRPLVQRVHTRAEFSDLIRDMQGDLKTSHCYEYRGDYLRKPTYQPCGYLGGKLSYRKRNQSFVVESLQRGEGWNAATRSPLLGPGIALSEGDEILKIDGQSFTSHHELDQYLDNRASTDVELIIKRTAKGSFHRSYKQAALSARQSSSIHRCTIKTLARHSELSYHDWVRNNRAYVHQQSNGTVGYLHIPDMSEFGLTEFYKHYLKELDYPQLIVDVRYNRGGYVSEIIINHLAAKAIASQRGKWMSHPQSYPLYSAPQKIVCLINGYAGSDGDIFSQAFKNLDLGTLVGTRTWGGVIGIWPRISLIDGTYTSQPEYSFVFHKNQRILENEGAVPDVMIEISPDDWQCQTDTQLEEALNHFELS